MKTIHKVYLTDLRGTNINVDENKYGVRTTAVFLDWFKLEDMRNIQNEIFYYLVNKEFIKDYNDFKANITKALKYMKHYIDVEDSNEPVKVEFKEVIKILEEMR